MGPKGDLKSLENRVVIQGLIKDCHEKTTKVICDIRDSYDDNGMPIVRGADPNDGEVPSTSADGAEENSGPAKNTRKRSGQ